MSSGSFSFDCGGLFILFIVVRIPDVVFDYGCLFMSKEVMGTDFHLRLAMSFSGTVQ